MEVVLTTQDIIGACLVFAVLLGFVIGLIVKGVKRDGQIENIKSDMEGLRMANSSKKTAIKELNDRIDSIRDNHDEKVVELMMTNRDLTHKIEELLRRMKIVESKNEGQNN